MFGFTYYLFITVQVFFILDLLYSSGILFHHDFHHDSCDYHWDFCDHSLLFELHVRLSDMAWFHSLIRNIIDEMAPIKSKIVKKKCVPYMNSILRKAQFARNMSRNKFRRFGKRYWEENRKMRNYVVKIRKMSLTNYFTKHCEKQDKNFWHTVSPFMSDKKYRNGGNITLNGNGETISDASRMFDIFNDFL